VLDDHPIDLACVGERLALAKLQIDESFARPSLGKSDAIWLGVVKHVRALVHDEEYGPFVMSSEQEIVQAFDDLESGKFGYLDD
jgi:hypothetical protein